MTQKLFLKNIGEIEVDRSWCDGGHHIARLTNGAYVHITGLPIKDEAEFGLVLKGEDLKEAVHWFRNRHDEEENRPRRIMFEGDGTPIFEDGTPVTSTSELIASLQPGKLLDAAIEALVIRQVAQKKAAARSAKEMARTAPPAVEEKVPVKKAPKSRKAAKGGKKAAARRSPASSKTAPTVEAAAPA